MKAVTSSQAPPRMQQLVCRVSSKVSRCVSWERIMSCGLLTGCQQTWNWQSGQVQPDFKWTDRKTNKINCSKYVRVNIYFWSYTVSVARRGLIYVTLFKYQHTCLFISPSLTRCQGKERARAHTHYTTAYPRHQPKCQGLKTQWLESTQMIKIRLRGRCRGLTLQSQTLPADSAPQRARY